MVFEEMAAGVVVVVVGAMVTVNDIVFFSVLGYPKLLDDPDRSRVEVAFSGDGLNIPMSFGGGLI